MLDGPEPQRSIILGIRHLPHGTLKGSPEKVVDQEPKEELKVKCHIEEQGQQFITPAIMAFPDQSVDRYNNSTNPGQNRYGADEDMNPECKGIDHNRCKIIKNHLCITPGGSLYPFSYVVIYCLIT